MVQIVKYDRHDFYTNGEIHGVCSTGREASQPARSDLSVGKSGNQIPALCQLDFPSSCMTVRENSRYKEAIDKTSATGSFTHFLHNVSTA